MPKSRWARTLLFLGILAFLPPLALLQTSVVNDRTSAVAVGTYTAWVVGYDIPWTYRLWRLNPATPNR